MWPKSIGMADLVDPIDLYIDSSLIFRRPHTQKIFFIKNTKTAIHPSIDNTITALLIIFCKGSFSIP